MSADFAALDLDTLLTQPIRKVQRGPCIIAVGSGSPGCGKSVLAWLLAIHLSRYGHKTFLLDSDLAAAGLYGRTDPAQSDQVLRRYLATRGGDINRTGLQQDNHNLFIITGSPSISGYPQLAFTAKQKILLHLRDLRADYLIIDTGKGPSYLHLDFFLAADLPLVITRFDTPSLLEAYQFIRIGLFRKVQQSARQWPDLFGYFSTLGEITARGEIKTIPAFIASHREPHAHACAIISSKVAAFKPRLLVNRAEAGADRRRLQTLNMVVHEILGVGIENWGEVREDEHLHKAVTAGAPLLLHGRAGMDVTRIIRERLLGSTAG